jgi:small-conductance mechanosensitive channel
MQLLSEAYSNLINTTVALGITLLAYGFVDMFFARKMNGAKKRRRFRIRSFYVFSFVFIFILARIWVEGFTHLLAVLGLVSAALVVTNKETIMNFVGWFVINWRGLFSEDDLIQIQQHKGYVKSFGLLYFTLQETGASSDERITGKVIRIPNGLITNTPLINLSQTDNLLEQSLSLIVPLNSNLPKSINAFTEVIDNFLSIFYKDNQNFCAQSANKTYKKNRLHIDLKARISMQLQQKDPKGVKLTAHYYCFSYDTEEVRRGLWMNLFQAIEQQKDLTLT